MSHIFRNTVRAAWIAAGMALLPSALDAQTEVRMMAHGGILPFVSGHAGGQLEITPAAGSVSYFAEYNRWAWGLVCTAVVDLNQSDAPSSYDGDAGRCAETGYTVHAGVTRHLKDADARWRPYLSAGAGVARVVDEYGGEHPAHASLAVEGGYDFGGARAFTLRLGARWQGRPQVATDYAGPVIGLRLRL